MSVIHSKTDLLERLKTKFGEDTSDDVLQIYEDISDTFDEHEKAVADKTDWKAKCEQTEAEWRKKYHDRFFNHSTEEVEQEESHYDLPKPMHYEDLFEEKEGK